MSWQPPPEGPDATTPPAGATPPGPPPPPLPHLHPSGQGDIGPLPTLPGGQAPHLREMRLGELLDAAIKLYRSNWKTFMGIVAFVVVPLQLLQNYLARDVFTTTAFETTNEVGSGELVTLLIFPAVQLLFVTPFLTAAIARATSEIYLGGQPGVGDVYSFALRRTHSILWVTFLSGLVTIFGFVALIIPGVIFFVRFSFSNSTVVVEGARGTKAMGRSWRLAKGFFWKIFGTVILAGILASIINSVIQIPLAIAADSIGTNGWLLRALGNSAGEVITSPFTGMVIVLLYFDMRIRKEGFDLALLAREMAPPAPA